MGPVWGAKRPIFTAWLSLPHPTTTLINIIENNSKARAFNFFIAYSLLSIYYPMGLKLTGSLHHTIGDLLA